MAHPLPSDSLQGDEGELFAAHHDHLIGVIGKRVDAPPAVIEDAVSVTWIIFLRVQPERCGSLFGWLVTVAEREAWRLARRLSRTLPTERLTADIPSGTSEIEEVVEARDGLRRGMAAMTERQRVIVALHAAGYRYSEIAELTGDSIRTVERQLHRGRARGRAAA